MVRRPVVVAVLVLLAAGCATGPAGEVPDPAPTAAPATPAPGGDDSTQVLRTRDELLDPSPAPISDWEEVGDDVLRLHVWSGPAECYGAIVDLEEDEDEIRVGVSVGGLASMAEIACAAVAVESAVDVVLRSPVGDREVVDTNAAR